MTRNLYEPTDQSRIVQNRYKIKDTRQKPLASQWIEPVNEGDPVPDIEPIWTPELENGWEQPTGTLERFAFRLHYDGSLEFRGHLDAQGAASGTVAVTLPGELVGDRNYLPPRDQDWHTTIRTAPGSGTVAFTLALVVIDATTGTVTLYWPAV